VIFKIIAFIEPPFMVSRLENIPTGHLLKFQPYLENSFAINNRKSKIIDYTQNISQKITGAD